jgi:hypothetical protein
MLHTPYLCAAPHLTHLCLQRSIILCRNRTRFIATALVLLLVAFSNPISARKLQDWLLDPDLQPKFVEPVSEVLLDDNTMTLYNKKTERFPLLTTVFCFFARRFKSHRRCIDGKPSGVISMGAYLISHEAGIIDPLTDERLTTPCFGYGRSAQTASWPGPTFEVKKQRTSDGTMEQRMSSMELPISPLLQHLLGNRSVFDDSIPWPYSMKNYKRYTIAKDGIPLVVFTDTV